jgi:CBS domain containing-hemolysin-like protein
MDKEALLFPVHLAMLIMVIGFFVFFFMALGGVKKVRKITRKANKRAKKAAVWIKNNDEYRKRWYYDI